MCFNNSNLHFLITAVILLNIGCSSSVEEVSKPLVDLPSVTAIPLGGIFASAQNVVLSCIDHKGNECTTYYSISVNDAIANPPQKYTSKIAVLLNQKTTITYYGDDGNTEGKSVTQEYITDSIKPTATFSPDNNTIIDPTREIIIIFDEAMKQDSQVIVGTLVEHNGGIWSTDIEENDT